MNAALWLVVVGVVIGATGFAALLLAFVWWQVSVRGWITGRVDSLFTWVAWKS